MLDFMWSFTGRWYKKIKVMIVCDHGRPDKK